MDFFAKRTSFSTYELLLKYQAGSDQWAWSFLVEREELLDWSNSPTEIWNVCNKIYGMLPYKHNSLPLGPILLLIFSRAPHGYQLKYPRPRINRPRTHRLACEGNLCLFTAANVDFIDIFLI